MDRLSNPDHPRVPPDLVDLVLARTSGKACGRAEALLPERTDGTLEPTDGDLLQLHLTHCADCSTLSAALVRLALDLPNLCEAPLDARFARDVLAGTSHSPLRRLLGWAARASVGWERLVLRPRLAAEGAYLGALVLAALLGLGGGDLSRHAAALAAANPVRAAAAPAARAGSALDAAADGVRTQVLASVAPAVDGVEFTLRENAAPFRLAAHRLKQAVSDLWSTGEPPSPGQRPMGETPVVPVMPVTPVMEDPR